MHLDMTITFGNVLSLAGTVVAIVAGYVKLRDRLTTIETKLGPIWEAFLQGKLH